MNDNRSHDYGNYVNSYGIQEVRRAAGIARLLKSSESKSPEARNANQLVLRFAGIVIAVSLLVFFFS